MNSGQPVRSPREAADVAADLCGRCRFSPTCVYCTAEREPIFACPGFLPDATVLQRSVGVDQSGAIGLCTTCERIESCTRDRPQSGVWHCEDYC